jgi:uncharacterized flavoprotein (TIGR03862 family)
LKTVAIIGAGPGGLMAAETLAKRGFQVTVYDHKPSPARKFLMAGRGGLNITHSEPLDKFLARYGEAANTLRPAIENFTPQNLRDWCHDLGEETFIGTSGRVFPQSFKASPLLRAWLTRLQNSGVKFHYNFEWTGQDMGADITILALGGASWPKLGSDGNWASILQKNNISINPFRPANCGFTTKWSDIFKSKYAGQPLKNTNLMHGKNTIQGEMMITQNGVEGGGIYALSNSIRAGLDADGSTILKLDFKPKITEDMIAKMLNAPRGRDSFSNYLRKVLALSPVAIALLNEDRNIANLSRAELAARIKSYPITINGIADIDRAISTAGGIALTEIDENFQLKKMTGTYVIGEMLDWEAPTGGYLLQATFSMAVWVGKNIT